MPSNISFFMTTPQFLDGTKDVTRRTGWQKLKPGARLMAVRKSQGLGKGGKIERFGEIEVTSVRREPLDAITDDDVRREGFPNMTRHQFIEFFCKSHAGCQPHSTITRIEFRKV